MLHLRFALLHCVQHATITFTLGHRLQNFLAHNAIRRAVCFKAIYFTHAKIGSEQRHIHDDFLVLLYGRKEEGRVRVPDTIQDTMIAYEYEPWRDPPAGNYKSDHHGGCES